MDRRNHMITEVQLDFLTDLEESLDEQRRKTAMVNLTDCLVSHGIHHDRDRGVYYGNGVGLTLLTDLC